MLGWILFVLFLVYNVAEEGAAVTLVGLAAALGVDVAAALVIGTSLSSILTGWGLADDAIMFLFQSELNYVEKVGLAVFLDESQHVEHEIREDWAHTDRENEQYARYLQRHEPGQTFLFGDVTPRDLFDLGVSGGVLAHYGTLGTILDAAKERYGGLITATSEVLAVGGGA